jgi:A/G-specific adenine glycosylase
MYPLGLHWRIPLMVRLLRALADRDGQVPCDLDEMMALPGVGPYAASATLSLHCGRRFPIIDANVVRWICRLVGAAIDGETRRKRWLLELAERLTPARNWRVFNYGIFDFTIEICARRPHCHRCPVRAALCLHGALILDSRR